MNRASIFLTHVASQLIYRWIPPDFDDAHAVECPTQLSGLDLEDLTYAQWRALLVDAWGLPNLRHRWLEDYLRRPQGSYDRLIQQCLNHLQATQEHGIKNILICDPEYPPLLRALRDPPLCLSVQGCLDVLQRPRISVIGSRSASHRALAQSRELGRSLATAGYAVVSGGAFGCDIASHKGVLASGISPAPAIVVFAGGLNSLYPGGNRTTFREILDRGGLFLSERLWSAPARPFDFPVRNRIVSGLSRETIVMQAAVRSGAMVTAQLALEQGREVSVLAFSRDEIGAQGCEELAADGAFAFSHVGEWFDRRSL